MRTFLRRLNDLSVFDPQRWPHRETLARLTGTLICAGFVVHRLLHFTRYTGDIPPFLRWIDAMLRGAIPWGPIRLTGTDWHWIMWLAVWVIETGIFVGYILAFATRLQARSVARGFMEVVFPLGVAAIPVIITLTPMNFQSLWPPVLRAIGYHLPTALQPLFLNWEPAFFLFLALIIGGGAVNLVGLFTLRRAFTIMSEARLFMQNGIFRYVRHPLYAGHFLMFFGYLLFHLTGVTALLYLAFLAGQYVRARIEEAKLTAVFPAYADYRRTTGMFFPRCRRRGLAPRA